MRAQANFAAHESVTESAKMSGAASTSALPLRPSSRLSQAVGKRWLASTDLGDTSDAKIDLGDAFRSAVASLHKPHGVAYTLQYSALELRLLITESPGPTKWPMSM